MEADEKQKPESLGGGKAPKPKCGIKKRQFPYTPCKLAAGYGTDHLGIGACSYHGGLLNNHTEHAERVRLEEGAKTLLRRENIEPVDNPLLELQLLAGEVKRFKDILGDKVEELGSWTNESLMESEEIRAIIAAYERALDRTMHVMAGIVRLNIEERLAKVSEAQALILIEIVEAVLDSGELGLSKAKRRVGRTILAREVTAHASISAA